MGKTEKLDHLYIVYCSQTEVYVHAGISIQVSLGDERPAELTAGPVPFVATSPCCRGVADPPKKILKLCLSAGLEVRLKEGMGSSGCG